MLLANTDEQKPDAQGRISIPARMREYAGLSKDVVITGVGTRMELWDADEWTRYEATHEETYAAPERGVLDDSRAVTRPPWRPACTRPGPDTTSPVPGPPGGWGPGARAAGPPDDPQPPPLREKDRDDRPARRDPRPGARRPRRPLLGPAVSAPGAILVDATLGMAGHTLQLLRSHPALTVIGIDRDPQALALAAERLAAAGRRRPCVLVHAVYDEIGAVARRHAPRGRVQAAFFDLGVSSLQLDERERGFAYAADAPLDMRMDPTTGASAADVLNTYSAAELTRVLREYGEERFASRIAAGIVRERERQPFSSSARLVELLYAAIPAATRRTGGHPAKRTFQALRIEVNDELGCRTPGDPGRARPPRRRRPAGGALVPLARGPDRQARDRAPDACRPRRSTCPSICPGTIRSSAIWCAGAARHPPSRRSP